MKNIKRYKIADFILICLVAILMILFILLPFFAVLKESIYSNNEFNFKYIIEILQKPKLIKNSLKVAFFTTIGTSLVSICISVYYYISNKISKKIIKIILSITIISPPFVTALSYINLFGRRGLISYYLLKLSINPYGMWGVILMQIISDFSLASLLLIGYISSIDKSLIDSSKSLGAKTNDIIKDILIPYMLPAIRASALLTFLRSLSDFGTVAIIGGNFNVLASESYFAIISEGNVARAASINIFLLIPALIVFIFYQKSIKNISLSSYGPGSGYTGIRKRGYIYYIMKIISIIFILWISIQYASIFLSSISVMRKGKLVYTLQNIIDAKVYFNKTLIRSIYYSFIAAFFGSILGLILAYYLQIRKIKIFRVIDFIATLPYIIPGTFFGLGYLMAFNKPPLYMVGTSAIVILNVLFKQLPFSTKMGLASMEKINIDSLNSVRDLGGNRISELKDIIFPMSQDALAISFINAFTTTMTTIGSIIFLVSPGQKVLTIVMFDLIQSGNYNIGSVIAVLIIFLCLLMNLLYLLVMNRKSIFKRSI